MDFTRGKHLALGNVGVIAGHFSELPSGAEALRKRDERMRDFGGLGENFAIFGPESSLKVPSKCRACCAVPEPISSAVRGGALGFKAARRASCMGIFKKTM